VGEVATHLHPKPRLRMSAITPTVAYTYMYGTGSTLLKLHDLQTLQLLVIVKYSHYKKQVFVNRTMGICRLLRVP
jgi:hypothetical protein